MKASTLNDLEGHTPSLITSAVSYFSDNCASCYWIKQTWSKAAKLSYCQFGW